jgi:hypothetical protein
MADHGSSWDPNVIGPLDLCSNCWTPISQAVAYCPTCGHVSLAFHSLPLERGERCANHVSRAAEWTCCLCQRPICKECCARETNPFTAPGPLWYCHECLEASNAIESKFRDLLIATNCCAKHRDIARAFSCKKCATPLCLSCTYFTSTGILKKRPADGPYCLSCFRMATLGGTRKRWFSGHDVAHVFL